MKRYLNLDGQSGVDAYETGDDYIDVRFRAGTVYTYTSASVGARHLAALKRLAAQGRGLATYISSHRDVHDNYASKAPED
ncbi:hypothetical protein [Paraburkholderia sp.]|uniref:hypothetical protein n=1 Tax=Paraburkholderia sp. TaxID=1926495 RepID=UPI00239853C7|nr:hypothetical protein [Paraburkholderia sp.]MDE1183335.1 hypothetical protein [Paraburkholderia sp.]